MSDDFFQEKPPGILDEDDPALDYILYNEMVKDEQKQRSSGKGGCLTLIMVILVPLASILLLSGPTLSQAPLFSATEKADHYCDDPASWKQWNKLLADAPSDDGIAALYAFRVGLCSMVKSGQIETGRATRLFEGMRDTVLRGAEEAQRQDAKDKGI